MLPSTGTSLGLQAGVIDTSRRSASPFFVPEVVLAEALRKTVGVEPMALGIP
jgi:hypothetical protein